MALTQTESEHIKDCSEGKAWRRTQKETVYKVRVQNQHKIKTRSTDNKPIPELNLQNQFHNGAKKQNARNKRFTDNGNS